MRFEVAGKMLLAVSSLVEVASTGARGVGVTAGVSRSPGAAEERSISSTSGRRDRPCKRETVGLAQDSSRIDNFLFTTRREDHPLNDPPATCIVPKRCVQVGTRPVGHERLARADTSVFDSPHITRGPLLLFIELDVYTALSGTYGTRRPPVQGRAHARGLRAAICRRCNPSPALRVSRVAAVDNAS